MHLLIFSGSYGRSYHSPILAYDVSTGRMKTTLRLSNSSNYNSSIKEENGLQNQSKILPDYSIVLIAISCTLLLAMFIYLFYRKIRKNSVSNNGKIKSNGPIREVWANPNTDNTNNIITFDKMSCSNNHCSNMYQRPCNLNISNTIEFDK
jgi:hypothetical protein